METERKYQCDTPSYMYVFAQSFFSLRCWRAPQSWVTPFLFSLFTLISPHLLPITSFLFHHVSHPLFSLFHHYILGKNKHFVRPKYASLCPSVKNKQVGNERDPPFNSLYIYLGVLGCRAQKVKGFRRLVLAPQRIRYEMAFDTPQQKWMGCRCVKLLEELLLFFFIYLDIHAAR